MVVPEILNEKYGALSKHEDSPPVELRGVTLPVAGYLSNCTAASGLTAPLLVMFRVSVISSLLNSIETSQYHQIQQDSLHYFLSFKGIIPCSFPFATCSDSSCSLLVLLSTWPSDAGRQAYWFLLSTISFLGDHINHHDFKYCLCAKSFWSVFIIQVFL